MDDSSYEELNGKFTSASKMEEKQMKAIEELVETEKRYLSLLQLCATDIRNHLQCKQVPDLDLEGLFGGTDEVLHVSSNLLKNLEAAATGKPDQVLLISNVFLIFKQELEDAYKEYCANYENMLQLETNYKGNELIWKEVRDTLNEVGSHTGAITLTFFLVTPVQRIGKYPLLLKTILENTAPSDEGYTALEKATVAMQEVNYNINEYKRLKEVVMKYSKQENLSLRDTIGRINKHSIAKKASRLSQAIKHETGILPKVTDKDYEDSVKLFYVIEKNVTTLKKNTESFIKNMEHFQNLRSYHYVPNLVDEHTTICYQEFIQILHQMIIPEFFLFSSKDNFWQQTEETLQKSSVKLETFCQIFESMMEQPIEQPYNEEKLETLLKKYSPEKIYQVNCNVSGNKDLDLTLQRGDLVALLQATDTRGNTNRWLVDSGGHRGFVPAGKLSPLQPGKQLNNFPQSPSLDHIVDGAINRTISSPSPESPLCRLPEPMQYQVIAAYPFTARGPHEASLQPGQTVTILEAHDKKGNNEWYLVEVNGQRGYVPSNYLMKVPCTGGRKSFAL
ncbi:rho guanine nucleotide exchange factor 37 isoform X2 [Chiloscyllium punctatum]|uniref:rho guanine nucleotide exchange factor 37 isoform X2 n=1 Tax=Chiloscyllium punctatum TaxID=137246 RepID=UPI003B63B6AD